MSVDQSLYINHNTQVTVALLPELTFVGAYFQVSHDGVLTPASFPQLQYVGTAFDFDNNPVLATALVPQLTFIGQFATIANNPTLSEFSVPALTLVVQYFGGFSNSELTILDAPVISKVACESGCGGYALDVCNNEAGFEFSLAVLGAATASGFPLKCAAAAYSGNAECSQCDNAAAFNSQLSTYTSVSGEVFIGLVALDIIYAPALTFVGNFFVAGNVAGLLLVDLPHLSFISSFVTVADNPELTCINFPKLTYVGQFIEFYGSSALTYASVPILSKIACLSGGCNNFVADFCSNAVDFTYSTAAKTVAKASGLTCLCC